MNTNLNLFQLIYNLNAVTIFSNWLGLFLGEYLIYILGGSAVLYFILKSKTKEEKISWLFTLIAAGILSNLIINPLIHYFYQLPRPFIALSGIGQYKHLLSLAEYTTSFPSGHTSMAFAIAIVMFLRNKKIGGLALITAILIGLGRILMGVHWPSDILGGIGVGTLSALIAYKIVMEIIVAKKTPKN